MRRKPLTAEERQDEEGNHGDCAGGIGNSNVYVCVRVAPQFAWTGSRRRAILAVWVSGRGLHVLEEFGAIPSPSSRGVSAAGPMRSKTSMSRTDTAPERMTAATSTAAAGRARSASWPAQGAPCRVVPSGADSGHPRRRSGSGCADRAPIRARPPATTCRTSRASGCLLCRWKRCARVRSETQAAEWLGFVCG